MTPTYATPELADLGSAVTTTGTMSVGTSPDGSGVLKNAASSSGTSVETAAETGSDTD